MTLKLRGGRSRRKRTMIAREGYRGLAHACSLQQPPPAPDLRSYQMPVVRFRDLRCICDHSRDPLKTEPWTACNLHVHNRPWMENTAQDMQRSYPETRATVTLASHRGVSNLGCSESGISWGRSLLFHGLHTAPLVRAAWNPGQARGMIDSSSKIP